MDCVDLGNCLAEELPEALKLVHREHRVGTRVSVRFPNESKLDARRLEDITVGSGLALDRNQRRDRMVVERCWTLPDTVGQGMKLLVSGLNPSPAAADAGVGFARPGNRFWPAALRAGLVTIDRDPDNALEEHGLGMTDMVKRTTRKASELTAAEYRSGLDRVRRLTEWLAPGAICFVGLAGWRSAFDKSATAGWQPEKIARTPVYVMPSTSGLNASSSLDDLTRHLEAASGRSGR